MSRAKFSRFKPSLAQQRRISAYSSQFSADPERRAQLLSDPNTHERVKQSIQAQIEFEAKYAQPAKPRSRLPIAESPHKEPLERDIQKAIIEALRLHPRVIKVVRFNSGGAYFRNAQGKDALVLFSSEPVVDLFVLLKPAQDRSGFAWLEVKRPSWHRPSDAREERQAAFLEAVRAAGGIGRFVRSIDEALEAING